MEFDILQQLDELEMLEITRLSERFTALNELKLGKGNFDMDNDLQDEIIKRIDKDIAQTSEKARKWWNIRYEKYNK